MRSIFRRNRRPPGPRARRRPPPVLESLEDRVVPGAGTFSDGKFNFAISVFPGITDAQLVVVRKCFQRASDVLADATDGCHRFGTITILKNQGGDDDWPGTGDFRGDPNAEFWICKNPTGTSDPGGYGKPGDHAFIGYTYMGEWSTNAYTIVHEFGHLAYGLWDEYCGMDGAQPGEAGYDDDGDGYECADPTVANPDYCIMDSRNMSNLSEFCVSINHDPDWDTCQQAMTFMSCRESMAMLEKPWWVPLPLIPGPPGLPWVPKLPDPAPPPSQAVSWVYEGDAPGVRIDASGVLWVSGTVYSDTLAVTNMADDPSGTYNCTVSVRQSDGGHDRYAPRSWDFTGISKVRLDAREDTPGFDGDVYEIHLGECSLPVEVKDTGSAGIGSADKVLVLGTPDGDSFSASMHGVLTDGHSRIQCWDVENVTVLGLGGTDSLSVDLSDPGAGTVTNTFSFVGDGRPDSDAATRLAQKDELLLWGGVFAGRTFRSNTPDFSFDEIGTYYITYKRGDATAFFVAADPFLGQIIDCNEAATTTFDLGLEPSWVGRRDAFLADRSLPAPVPDRPGMTSASELRLVRSPAAPPATPGLAQPPVWFRNPSGRLEVTGTDLVPEQYHVTPPNPSSTHELCIEGRGGVDYFTCSGDFSGPSPVSLYGGEGNDLLVLDFSAGIPLPAGGMLFHGGGQTSIPGDRVRIIGNLALGVSDYAPGYRPGDEPYTGDFYPAKATQPSRKLHYTGLEPFLVSSMAGVRLTTPGSTDYLVIDSPVAGQTRVSGSSDGSGFESLTISDTRHLILDVAAGNTGSADDLVVIKAPLTVLGLDDLTIHAGAGANVLNLDVQGAAAAVTASSVLVPGWAPIYFDAGTLTVNVFSHKDNGEWGYRERGLWQTCDAPGCYGGTARVMPRGRGEGTATWTVQLPRGWYDVYTDWVSVPGAAGNAPYTILDGAVRRGLVSLSQQLNPAAGPFAGVAWAKLARVYVGTGVLTVQLNNAADGCVVADAVYAVPVSSPLMAEGGPAGAGGPVAVLEPAQVQPLVAEAVSRWAAALPDPDARRALQAVTVLVADLPGALLGRASGTTVWIDPTAAGYDWFVDPTPADDREYVAGRAAAGPARGRMDLLTVLTHELGHVLGLPDLDAADDDLMAAALAPGARRLPPAASSPPSPRTPAMPPALAAPAPRRLALPDARDAAFRRWSAPANPALERLGYALAWEAARARRRG